MSVGVDPIRPSAPGASGAPDVDDPPRPNRQEFRRVAVFLALAPLLVLAFTAAGELVPDEQMLDAIIEAGDDGPLNAVNRTPTRLLTPSDRWTECLVLTMGIGDDHFGSTLNQTLRSSTFGPCDVSTRHIEQASVAGEPVTASIEYYRYWWSAGSILRPSVVLLGIPGTRILVQGFVLTAFALLFGAWRRRLGWLVALAVLGPLVVATDFLVLYESLPQALAVTAALAASLVMLLLVEKADRAVEVVFPAVVAGAIVLPFDLMMVIPLALTLCVATAVLVASREGLHVKSRGRSELVKRAAAAGFGWILGFGWLWLTKWLFVAAVIGPSAVIDNVAASFGTRVSYDVGGSATGPFQGIRSNIQYWWRQQFGLAALTFEAAVLSAALLRWIKQPHRISPSVETRQGIAIVALCAGIPFAWYEFSSNHSQVHNWFVFRAVPLSLGLLVGAAVLALQATTKDAA